jgi:hypothetical protein
MRRPVSRRDALKLPIGNALEVQKGTGDEEEYQQAADADEEGLRRKHSTQRVVVEAGGQWRWVAEANRKVRA